MAISSQPLTQRLIVQLGASSYFVRNRIEYELPHDVPAASKAPTPVVVISLANIPITLAAIQNKLSQFEARDDVYRREFNSGGYLIVQQLTDQATSKLPRDVKDYLNESSTKLLTLNEKLPEGPYFALGGRLHQAWRLFPDNLSAFTVAVIPDDENALGKTAQIGQKYQAFHGAAFTDATAALSVPVPSRLYFTKSAEQPFAGLRIAVKDNMHLAGTVTGLGSRSYAELYGIQDTTAKYIESLQRKGAVIVGKTKLSAFAGSEVPPNQCIDYFPPWNPRGDGYQGPSGSSSGAAAVIAGYPWIDASLCTDTSGSMRFPSSSHGTWGHRITWGAVSMEGIVPAVQVYDNLGLLARTPARLQELLFQNNPNCTALDHDSDRKSKRLIYPTDWYPLANANQQAMTDAFIQKLEDILGVSATKLSILKEWERTNPVNTQNSLIDYLGMSAYAVNGYYGYRNFDSFRQGYREKFGKKPYVSPSHTARWAKNAKWTEKERDESLEKIKVFKNWWAEHIWRVDDEGGFTIMIIPQGRSGANYRDRIPESINGDTGPDPMSYDEIFVTSMLGCPQLVVPIGQNPYDSEVSGLVEYAPIVTTLVGPPYYDKLLVDLASAALEQAGWPTSILTGRFMFEKGDNERNTAYASKQKL